MTLEKKQLNLDDENHWKDFEDNWFGIPSVVSKKEAYGEITAKTLEEIILALTPHSNSELRAHTPIKVATANSKIKLSTVNER